MKSKINLEDFRNHALELLQAGLQRNYGHTMRVVLIIPCALDVEGSEVTLDQLEIFSETRGFRGAKRPQLCAGDVTYEHTQWFDLLIILGAKVLLNSQMFESLLLLLGGDDDPQVERNAVKAHRIQTTKRSGRNLEMMNVVHPWNDSTPLLQFQEKR